MSAQEQYNLALNYLKGQNGSPKDTKKAIDLLIGLANQNHTAAINHICYLFFQNVGLPQDYANISALLIQRIARAQYRLAIMFLEGHGVDIDIENAQKLLELACQAGVEDACIKLEELEEPEEPEEPVRRFTTPSP